MYECIAKFAENVSDNELYWKTIKTKENIIKAYSQVDIEKWENADKEIQNGIEKYAPLLEDSKLQDKVININKTYIILNEMKNAIAKKDKEIFLVKYKNILEEMNSIWYN